MVAGMQIIMDDRIPWTTADIIKTTGGELISGDIGHTFRSIGIDSRAIRAGELFVAIKGDNTFRYIEKLYE